MGFDPFVEFASGSSFNYRKKKGNKTNRIRTRTYRVMVRGGRVGGEEDRERSNEEEGEHSGDEDPVGEEAPETETTEACSSASASASTDGDRHLEQATTLLMRTSFNLQLLSSIQRMQEPKLEKKQCLCGLCGSESN